MVQQADRDTPRSVGGRIDDWFNRILSRLPQQQINTLREQVEKYLTRKDEKEELTDDDLIENAKCLIKGVMEKFSTDGDQSAVHNCKLLKLTSATCLQNNRIRGRFSAQNLVRLLDRASCETNIRQES